VTPEAQMVDTSKAFEDALLAVQEQVQELELTREATGQVQSRFFKYLTYPKLLNEVRPILTRNGLVWKTFPTTLEGRPALRYTLSGFGEELSDTMLLMLDKETSQAQGSGLTYARRQALSAVLEITPDEDDDGRAASQPARPEPVDPEKPMSEANVQGMLEAIAERKLSVGKVLERAGVDGETPTIEQGLKVKAILDAIDKRRAEAGS
jgi:hypothetical protein